MTELPDTYAITAHALRKRASDIKLRTIAKECNVSIGWLSKLQNEHLVEPKSYKLQCVYAWLVEAERKK